MKSKKTKKIRGVKRLFLKKGTCSQTYFYLLNRELGFHHEEEERAIDTLAGGIYQQGYQCGMLWGTAMAIGAESYRMTTITDRSIPVAITATQKVLESFKKRTNTIECEEITRCDWDNRFSIAKYMMSGKAYSCFRLAAKWAPEAIKAALEGLSDDQDGPSEQPASCASDVIRKMGGSEKEMAMVAGFAGGLGLSGSGCGALAAAIWYRTLARVRKQEYKYSLSDPELAGLINKFYQASDYEMECCKITRRQFKTPDEHAEFVRNGGCNKLIEALANVL